MSTIQGVTSSPHAEGWGALLDLAVAEPGGLHLSFSIFIRLLPPCAGRYGTGPRSKGEPKDSYYIWGLVRKAK